MQQLFGLINEVLAHSPATAKRQLRIVTYKVINVCNVYVAERLMLCVVRSKCVPKTISSFLTGPIKHQVQSVSYANLPKAGGLGGMVNTAALWASPSLCRARPHQHHHRGHMLYI